jgi:hypothetical protein
MMGRWHFSTDDRGVIHLLARFEGDGGMVGDAYHAVHPGETFCGVTYAEYYAERAGILLLRGRRRPRIK